ncbi:MAG TPA: alkaline shock response membrane anchor protein AmaP [Sphingobacteriaceae bacterium]|nr:alkaline shock response membrane anchor protein AmaP [Sphingobacteriaceae bacterium]
MGIIDQIILALYTISLAVISFLVFLVMALRWRVPLDYLQTLLTRDPARWVAALVAAVFFVSSVRLLIFAFRRRAAGAALVHDSALGEVQISLKAVENLVARAGRQVEGVRELNARVESGKDGIQVHLRGSVYPEVNIPELSDRLQNLVKRHVRSVVGVEVENVRFHVKDIGDDRRRRVD